MNQAAGAGISSGADIGVDLSSAEAVSPREEPADANSTVEGAAGGSSDRASSGSPPSAMHREAEAARLRALRCDCASGTARSASAAHSTLSATAKRRSSSHWHAGCNTR